MTDLHVELATACRLARQAGALALEVYARDFSAQQKADRSPVTEADRRVNAFLCAELARSFPGDLVVGEESGFGGKVPERGRAWFIDPVDGTKDFILKNDEWSIMIGLVIDGEAVVGVVYEPAPDRLYFASRGEGAFREAGGETVTLERAAHKRVEDAVVINSRNHPDPRIERVVERLGITRQTTHGSVGCKLARIAEGAADIYFNFSGKCGMWDTCAPEVIIREAGGDLVDFSGNPLRYCGDNTDVDVPFYASTAAVSGAVGDAVRALASALQPE
jgi:3'(2'), 5'-bisphosphate nucleotidase